MEYIWAKMAWWVEKTRDQEEERRIKQLKGAGVAEEKLSISWEEEEKLRKLAKDLELINLVGKFWDFQNSPWS